jgi:hypothetical protein
MQVKLTEKNESTILNRVLSIFLKVEYFDVEPRKNVHFYEKRGRRPYSTWKLSVGDRDEEVTEHD